MQFNIGIGEQYQWYIAANSGRGAVKSKHRQVYSRRVRPPYTYTELITQAITASTDHSLTLRQIVTCLENRYACFRGPYRGWRNSIRHNLSASECFRKILRDESKPNGKDNYWTMNENCRHCKEKRLKSSTSDDVTETKVTNDEKQEEGCQAEGSVELNNNINNISVDNIMGTTNTVGNKKAVDTEAPIDDGFTKTKPTAPSQGDFRRVSCTENFDCASEEKAQPEKNDLTAWREMEGYNIDRFAYDSLYDFPCEIDSFQQKVQGTWTQPEPHLQQQQRVYVQSNQGPYPVHSATHQGYPVAHDMYRNGHCAPPYNMVDQSVFLSSSNSSQLQQQQYARMNYGGFYGPGSQVAQQVQFMSGRAHQDSVCYQQL